MARYGAPVDEVALALRVAPEVAALGGELPGLDDLAAAANRHGLDYATMLFYRAILDSPRHGAFAREIDALPAAPPVSKAPAGPPRPRLLIVPALFYRERPDLGGDGRLIAEVARACGFAAEVVPIASRGGVRENAALLWRTVRERPEEPLWLLSLSKGGAEVRVALTDHADEPEVSRVRGWVNVNGLANGSHLMDHMLGSAIERLKLRAFLLALRIPMAHVRDFGTAGPLWRRPFPLADRLTIVNLIGVPLLSHMPSRLLERYRQLGRTGPNDGFALLPELLFLPGEIYPVWGANHLFRSPLVSPLLYRLFAWIRGRTAAGW